MERLAVVEAQELGLAEGADEVIEGKDMRQVGEGTGGARHRDAEAIVPVGLEEDRPMARDLLVTTVVSGGDVRVGPFAVADAPQRRRAPMAQNRPFPAREDRGEPTGLTAGRLVADPVDASMHQMPATGAATQRYGVRCEPDLPDRDDAVLAAARAANSASVVTNPCICRASDHRRGIRPRPSGHIASLAATVTWCVVAWVGVGLGTCGGDGGEPNAELGSVAQRFCDGSFDSLWPLLVAFAVAAVVADFIGLARLQAGRPGGPAIRWLIVAYLVLVPYSVPVFLPTS